MNWQVYIIRCSDGSLYTGITLDIARRLSQHGTQDAAQPTLCASVKLRRLAIDIVRVHHLPVRTACDINLFEHRAVLFFGGVQLFFLGIIGEYLGRVFNETKKRPLYLIQEHLEALPQSAAKPKEAKSDA